MASSHPMQPDRFLSVSRVLLGVMGLFIFVAALGLEFLPGASGNGLNLPQLAVMAFGGAVLGISLSPLPRIALQFFPSPLFPGLMLSVGIFAFFIFSAEYGLRFLNHSHPYVAKVIPDPILGHRHPPNCPGHDGWGFRNTQVPSHADIVAIGDSMTWSLNAGPGEAWPEVLAKRSGKSVYNMGVSGYGPAQYLELASQALQLSPQVLLFAIFLGNDIFDSFTTVYQNPLYAHLRDIHHNATEVASGVQLYDEVILEAQYYAVWYTLASAPIWERVLRSSALASRLRRDPERDGAFGVPLNPGHEAWKAHRPEAVEILHIPKQETVLLQPAPSLGLSRKNSWLPEGMRLAKAFFQKIQALAREQKKRTLIGIIPTKEYLYRSLINHRGLTASPPWNLFPNDEGEILQELRSALTDQGFEYVDLSKALFDALASGERLYPSGPDSHPNRVGYRVIGEAFFKALSTNDPPR